MAILVTGAVGRKVAQCEGQYAYSSLDPNPTQYIEMLTEDV